MPANKSRANTNKDNDAGDKYETTYGIVTVKPRHFNWILNSFVIELKLTPPNLWGWGITATFPEEMEDKVTQEFAQAWAGEAIDKLV